MGNKNMVVANFNAVFTEGSEDRPLLDYFNEIVYPAFTSGKVRKRKDAEYLIMDVEVVEDKAGDLVFKGKIVKKTMLEIKSDIDQNGRLVEKDDRYSTAPFSFFAIYLKNHRMIYVENQKGSPTLSNFAATAKYLLNQFVRAENRLRKAEEKGELPIPILNVIGIPNKDNLESVLQSVECVNKLTLKFMPLNGDGDIDFAGMFNTMSTQLRKAVGCEKGQVTLNSPQNINGIIEVIGQAEGTVEPIIHVTYPNKSKQTITNDIISESVKINILGDNIREFEDEIIEMGKENKSIKFVSDSNKAKYEERKAEIIDFAKRRKK